MDAERHAPSHCARDEGFANFARALQSWGASWIGPRLFGHGKGATGTAFLVRGLGSVGGSRGPWRDPAVRRSVWSVQYQAARNPGARCLRRDRAAKCFWSPASFVGRPVSNCTRCVHVDLVSFAAAPPDPGRALRGPRQYLRDAQFAGLRLLQFSHAAMHIMCYRMRRLQLHHLRGLLVYHSVRESTLPELQLSLRRL